MRVRPFTIVLFVFLVLTFIVFLPIPFGIRETRILQQADSYIQKVLPVLRDDARFQSISLSPRNWGGWRTVDADGELKTFDDLVVLKSILVSNQPPFDLQVSIRTSHTNGLFIDFFSIEKQKWGKDPTKPSTATE